KSGSFIVYDVRATRPRGIFSGPLDGNEAAQIVAGTDDGTLIGWGPDGRHLIFSSRRSGKVRMWSVAISNWKAAADPEPVWPEIEISEPLGITKNGSLYYLISTDQSEAFVSEIDFANGDVISPPKRVSENYVGAKRSPVWSSDGKSLAYLAMGKIV